MKVNVFLNITGSITFKILSKRVSELFNILLWIDKVTNDTYALIYLEIDVYKFNRKQIFIIGVGIKNMLNLYIKFNKIIWTIFNCGT